MDAVDDEVDLLALGDARSARLASRSTPPWHTLRALDPVKVKKVENAWQSLFLLDP
jgi:hypothetical protein